MFESTISPHRAHKNSTCQFLRTHMCQTRMLLDAKPSEMFVGVHVDVSDHRAIFPGHEFLAWRHRTHRHTWIGFQHARVFLACEAFWILAGIHVDVSVHPATLKGTIPLQSLTMQIFDNRHSQGRPPELCTRAAGSPLKPSDTVLLLFFRILRMCDPITKPVSGLVYLCVCMHTCTNTHASLARSSVHMGN